MSDHEKVRETLRAALVDALIDWKDAGAHVEGVVTELEGLMIQHVSMALKPYRAALRSAPVEPESRDERVRYAMAHAYSDATTPGFFKVPTVGETNEPPTPVGKGEGDDERGRILQRGEHGGPLVQIVAEYEDGTKRNVDAAVRSLSAELQEARAVHMDAERDVQRTATMLSQLRAERDALAEKLERVRVDLDDLARLPWTTIGQGEAIERIVARLDAKATP
jgi:hypothetical protein